MFLPHPPFIRLPPLLRWVTGIKQQWKYWEGKRQQRGATGWGWIKTENYFFCSVWFEINFYCSSEGCPPLYTRKALSLGDGEVEQWRVPDEWDFVFIPSNAKRSDDFKCKWGNKISVFILFPHRFSFSCSRPLRSRVPATVVVCFSTSPPPRVERAKKENEKMFFELLLSGELGGWLFCASAGGKKYGFGAVLISCCYLNVKSEKGSPPVAQHSTARHKIKFL